MIQEVATFNKLGFKIIMRESRINDNNMSKQGFCSIVVSTALNHHPMFPTSPNVLNLRFDMVSEEKVGKKKEVYMPISEQHIVEIKQFVEKHKQEKHRLVVCCGNDGEIAYRLGEKISVMLGLDISLYKRRNHIHEHKSNKHFETIISTL